MTASPIRPGALGVALAAAAVLAACNSSHPAAQAPSATTNTTTSTSLAPPAPASTAAPVTSTTAGSAPTTTVTGSGPPATTAASGPSACPTSSLAAALTNPNGAAGSTYYSLTFTNKATVTCVLQGYPGVSFVSSSGQQVGAAADRLPGSAPSVSLAPGHTAHAVLQVTDAANYGTACGLTTVSGLRVYPPNQRAALYVPHSDKACTNSHDVTLHIGPVSTT